jgi:UDP-N-acetylmuramate--alanine ligase
MMNAFFIGIGGMGMSGLAKILHQAGYKVAGSDRNLEGEYCRRLREFAIPMYPQDGTGVETFLSSTGLSPADVTIVKSTAVEDQVPDVIAARRLGLKEIMRSDLLAQMFNSKRGIAIGGTSGKTTTSGLIAWVLKFAGLEPSTAIGGVICGLETNAFLGKGSTFVIEADESDGSIIKYTPAISLITNISRDHKSLEELYELFSTFSHNAVPDGTIIFCADDEHLNILKTRIKRPVLTYGFAAHADVRPSTSHIHKDHSTFTIDGVTFTVNLPGQHNLQNALAAVAVGKTLGIPLEELAAAINGFPGMKRRFEKVGTARGITVIDDFAHNPAEIAAAIEAARQTSKNRFIIYQPHGFGPTRFTRADLVKVFSALRPEENLYLDEIFYGGGTVEKDISSKTLVDEIRTTFPNAHFFGDRQKIVEDVVSRAKSGDMVLVMGARDINTICSKILASLQ